jgi:hypothetical protein
MHVNHFSAGRHGNPTYAMAFAVRVVQTTLNVLGCGSFLEVGNLFKRKYKPNLPAFLSRYETPITLKYMESLSTRLGKRIQAAARRRCWIRWLDVASQ